VVGDQGTHEPFTSCVDGDQGTHEPFTSCVDSDQGTHEPFTSCVDSDQGTHEPFISPLDSDHAFAHLNDIQGTSGDVGRDGPFEEKPSFELQKTGYAKVTYLLFFCLSG
jgi:hypothetical protein